MRPIIFSFRISKEEKKLIAKAARKRGIPMSDLIRFLIRLQLEKPLRADLSAGAGQ
ncbi:MAG: ribbon-helix-helix protein, CopG family [Deltaproteobacteria bacterium]|nr:ribbon-helix-helix protein, CopG family [Deltaproteobacteria bacterium]MBI4795900.1 ribbon-helix-helix protein, CopG family [Deltaproteobacteria bacterium]